MKPNILIIGAIALPLAVAQQARAGVTFNFDGNTIQTYTVSTTGYYTITERVRREVTVRPHSAASEPSSAAPST